jgi:leucyl/phenylalanyl-tRNA---protein transferase
MQDDSPPGDQWFILEQAQESGLVAIGGDFSLDSLLWAYGKGFFPWYKSRGLIHWFSPDPRFVISPDSFKIPKSLRSLLNSKRFRITFDTAFDAVVEACKDSPRPKQEGTWILPEMVAAYTRLHDKGLASSCEVWDSKKLVGGLYGVKLAKNFSGESMFSIENNASKLAFVHFANDFFEKGGRIIDCQIHSDLFQHFGGKSISRKDFELLWKKGLE